MKKLKIGIDFGASLNESETLKALEQIKKEHPEMTFGILRVQFYKDGVEPIKPLGYGIYHEVID